jgi:hypothetical protein
MLTRYQAIKKADSLTQQIGFCHFWQLDMLLLRQLNTASTVTKGLVVAFSATTDINLLFLFDLKLNR